MIIFVRFVSDQPIKRIECRRMHCFDDVDRPGHFEGEEYLPLILEVEKDDFSIERYEDICDIEVF